MAALSPNEFLKSSDPLIAAYLDAFKPNFRPCMYLKVAPASRRLSRGHPALGMQRRGLRTIGGQS